MNTQTITKTIKEIIDGSECPLPLEVIPNYMGINLCSVESVTWTRRDDTQLEDISIKFIPEERRKHTYDAAHARIPVEIVNHKKLAGKKGIIACPSQQYNGSLVVLIDGQYEDVHDENIKTLDGSRLIVP